MSGRLPQPRTVGVLILAVLTYVFALVALARVLVDAVQTVDAFGRGGRP